MSTSNYKYKTSDFTTIYASNSLDLSYNKTIPVYTSNSALITYNRTNGSTTQQGNIPYTYISSGIQYNYSYGIQAYYQEFTFAGWTSITIPNCCNSLGVFLVGAGGSGGAGGGDNTGKKGTNGAGGGGGAYVYYLLSLSGYNKTNWSVYVGAGGDPVSGGDPASGDSNNGMPGKAGQSTLLYYDSAIITANGGGGGDGGHPSSSATPGVGGSLGSYAAIQAGGNGSSSITGGLSGYSLFENAGVFTTYPKPYNTNTGYGNGGVGTAGGYDPNQSLTGPGINGYARIYFII